MILGPDILRWLTVLALRNRTWADDRVFDSPSQPADMKLANEREPYIGVFTDDTDVVLDPGNESVTVFLVVEVNVSDQYTVQTEPDPNNPDNIPSTAVVTTMSQTDEALEFAIGMISRQAMQALLAPDNRWAELWRNFALKRSKIEIRRGGPGSDDKEPFARYASKVARMTVEVLCDPVQGTPLAVTGVWREIVEAFLAEPEMKDIGEIIRVHIEGNAPLPSWEAAQASLGISGSAIRAVGISPVVIPDRVEPPTLRRAKLVSESGGTIGEVEEPSNG